MLLKQRPQRMLYVRDRQWSHGAMPCQRFRIDFHVLVDAFVCRHEPVSSACLVGSIFPPRDRSVSALSATGGKAAVYGHSVFALLMAWVTREHCFRRSKVADARLCPARLSDG